jgi:outer membrane protein assembly factor BamA
MHIFRQVKGSRLRPIVALACICLIFGACVTPKKNQFPKGKPFVFRTIIKLEANLPASERQDLIQRLKNQLDDSLRVETVTACCQLAPPWVYQKLVNPPVFDTANIGRSKIFMISLLNSIGYTEPVITDSIRIDTVRFRYGLTARVNQYRVFTTFRVKPGKNLKIDSVAFDLQTSALQALAIQSRDQSLLKRGTGYSKQLLANEIVRLVDTFRNNGFLRFTKEDLYIEHDTVVSGLIDPSLDPFQQAALLEKLKKMRENPVIRLTVRQRPPKDSAHIVRYYIGKVTIFPDLPFGEDTAAIKQDTTVIRQITLISRSNKFRLPFIVDNIFLRPGEMYRQENYFRTANRFSQLTAWQYSNIDFENSETVDTLVNITMRMYPAKKQSTNADLEASRNTNDIVTASNLFGIGVNFGLQNRNAFKQSIRTVTNLRAGVELGSNFIQTVQVSLSHTIAIPRLILPFKIGYDTRLRNVQTLLNLNTSYTNRKDFFELWSVNGAWGYQYTRNNKTYLFRIPNIEYTKLNQRDSLINLIKSVPALKEAFHTGLVIGSQFVYNSLRRKGNKSNRFRFSAEESGALLGLIPALARGELLRFVKGDVEYVHNIDYGQTNLVMRGYIGAGINYGRQDTGYQILPFYKAYWAGGPNSMRGWQVRQLGLGSSQFYNSPDHQGLDRFGDIQIEGNIEYRFPLGTVYGIKLKSALYTDIGNIWTRKPLDTSAIAQGSEFVINRFFKEFAVDAGTGLRLDFSYFLIRLDWAYKIRDPQRAEYPDRWFYGLTLGSGQFQLGINYPF